MNYESDSNSSTSHSEGERNDEYTESSDNDETFAEDGNHKPLELVTFARNKDDDGEDALHVKVNQDALDTVLTTCGDRRISVICVVGGVRTGKSVLLNSIKEKLISLEQGDKRPLGNKLYQGFAYKPGYKATTKGIWIWSRAFIVEDGDMAVLLLDTEGINDELSRPDEIAAIIGISLLSSSLLIVNASGVLSPNEFDWLSSFAPDNRKKTFQKASFVVRDWTSTNQHGIKGGAKYFDKFTRQNKSRFGFIPNVFEEHECFLLPHIGEELLHGNRKRQPKKVERDFSRQLNSYLTGLLETNSVPVKKIFDNELNAKDFKAFFLAFVEYFNDSREMEMGPKSEVISTIITKTAGQLKVARGLAEYYEGFRRRRRNSVGGYFRDTTIDGMHVQVKKKAVQGFKTFTLPADDEKQFEKKFAQELQKAHSELKSKNQVTRKNELDRNLDLAALRIRTDLEQEFPFTAPPERQVAADVFYDGNTLSHRLTVLREASLAEILDQFAGEDDAEKQDIENKFYSKLAPIEQEYTGKNGENKKRATDKARKLTRNLTKEYVAGMQDKINKLPDVNEKTLEIFHQGEVERIEQKFNAVNLGMEGFQKQYLKKLRAKVNSEYENMQMNLECIMTTAVQLVNEKERIYSQTLTTMAEDMTEEELLAFHRKSKEGILQEFSNPFPRDIAKAAQIEQRLITKLDKVYEKILKDGIISKKRQTEQFENMIEEGLVILQQNVDALLENTVYMDENQLNDLLTSNQGQVMEWLEEEISCVGVDKKTARRQKDKFRKETEKIVSAYKKKNSSGKKTALAEAEKLLSECVEYYDDKIGKMQKKVNTEEDLRELHERIKKHAVRKFKLPNIKDDCLIREYTEKLVSRIKEIYEETESHFGMKLRREDVGLMTALLDVKKYYQENMDKAFNNNRERSFSERELSAKHTQYHTAALNSISDDIKLNHGQRQKLDEHLNKLYLKYKEKNELIMNSYSRDIAIGIDLGTTYCCVAVYHMGTVKILRNSQGTNTTPSYVTINQDGTTLVGQPAKDQAYRNPDATIFDAKRIIGRRLSDEKLQEDMKFWPFSVEEKKGTARIKVHDKHYHPQEISSMILKHLKEEAESLLNLEIEKAVITVPAYFTDGQRQATIEAGELAGFTVLGLLNEPTAAAVAYRLLEWCNPGTSRNILVYDLGGGTFDVAVLEICDDKIEVLSINGDAHLGGEDFDKKMMEFCAIEFHNTTEIDLFEGKDSPVKPTRDDARRRLKRLQINCENKKKALGTARNLDTPSTIAIDEIVRGQDLNVDINQRQFDQENMALFKKTIAIVDDTLKSARVRKEEIDDVVMVGGSTRIPTLQKMLEAHFNGRPLNKSLNPDEAVAYGAAVQAAILNSGQDAKLFDFGSIQEATPMSLGIELLNKKLDVVIPKNTKIPAEETVTYSTYKDGQTFVPIRVFQGENLEVASENNLLGEFQLKDIPNGPAGSEKIDITMTVNLNGVLSVEAVCRSTNRKCSIKVTQQMGKLSKKEKERLLG